MAGSDRHQQVLVYRIRKRPKKCGGLFLQTLNTQVINARRQQKKSEICRLLVC